MYYLLISVTIHYPRSHNQCIREIAATMQHRHIDHNRYKIKQKVPQELEYYQWAQISLRTSCLSYPITLSLSLSLLGNHARQTQRAAFGFAGIQSAQFTISILFLLHSFPPFWLPLSLTQLALDFIDHMHIFHFLSV